ncbi:hypothetical protein [Hymenobacter terrenus]|uniref:hypothetical protein n=1 Tax=Hymenobacter terrenus TaxID=1629124 RepID=UPI00061905CD|nr:hypothetical protein [Hymenobacter terrenus]
MLVDARTGTETAQAAHAHARWKTLQYCNPVQNQFHQHPLDYIEGLENVVRRVARKVPAEQIVGLTVNIKMATSKQAPALGAAIYAAIAASIHPDVVAAQRAIGSGLAESYEPNPARVADYQARYEQYQAFGKFVEAATLDEKETKAAPEPDHA